MESDKYFGQIGEGLKQGDQEISSGTTSASLESMFLKDFMMQVQNDEGVINPFANRKRPYVPWKDNLHSGLLSKPTMYRIQFVFCICKYSQRCF